MDALEFYKSQNRYCSRTVCQDCRAYAICHSKDSNGMAEFVNFIEKWNESNSPTTRKQELLKVAPFAKLDTDGIPCICPKHWDNRFNCLSEIDKLCSDCRRLYWMEEI